jgi:glycosyltransferase involved in cell wall biosynthesis
MITYTGKVDDVAPYLAEIDVFGCPLRPDHYGTCEQVLGEAMAAGVVPVVMDNPCESEIVISGVTGLISHNEKEYVNNIVDMSLGLRHLHTKECRNRAETLYSIDTMIQQWNDVFNELMEKPKVSHDFGAQI